MKTRAFNWPIWVGFLLSVIAFLSYFVLFVWFPLTRDLPWANLLLFALAAALLLVGLRRAFAPGRAAPGRAAQAVSPPAEVVTTPFRKRRPRLAKIVASVLATLSFVIFGFFIFTTFIMGRWLPASHGAPQVGQKAPDFTLADTTGKPVSLTELLSSPVNGKTTKGVLLIFYRGSW